MKFSELGLIENLLKVLNEKEYFDPTPIQVQAIPPILAGNDVLGCAQTGTGKTAAFALPILQQLSKNKIDTSKHRNPRVLVVAPTRELAAQIKENVIIYSKNLKIKVTVIFGGVKQKAQEEDIKKGIDFLIATPGRLLDLINQKIVDLRDIEHLVLDEADRMLDMGFINDIRKILKYITKKHQTMLFSATMPKEIKVLADSILTNPTIITVAPEVITTDLIKQYLYYVDQGNKKKLLLKILEEKNNCSILIFTRTKHGSNKLVKELNQERIQSLAIHGNKSQNARMIALENFKNGKLKILIATDIVARGIDIIDLPCVINYDVPNEEETYVHRIGRTGRAGAEGVSYTLCNEAEVPLIFKIEKLIKKEITIIENHPYKPVFYKSLNSLKIPNKSIKKNKKNLENRPGASESRAKHKSEAANHIKKR